jgi:hypothetical protein
MRASTTRAGCLATLSRSCGHISRAGTSVEGQPSHTQYNSCSTIAEVRITRRHHPLEGQRVAILMAGPEKVIARIGDGTTMRIPRGWTDIDGVQSSLAVERVFSVDAMLALIELVDALGRRA